MGGTPEPGTDAVGSEESAPPTPPPASGPRSNRATRKSVLLRLDPAVHAALAKWASDDLRSVNAQIEVLLRDALRRAGRDAKADPMRGPGRPRRPREPDGLG